MKIFVSKAGKFVKIGVQKMEFVQEAYAIVYKDILDRTVQKQYVIRLNFIIQALGPALTLVGVVLMKILTQELV